MAFTATESSQVLGHFNLTVTAPPLPSRLGTVLSFLENLRNHNGRILHLTILPWPGTDMSDELLVKLYLTSVFQL